MSKLEKTSIHAPQFLTEKRSISIFLILVSIFAMLVMVVYKPVGEMRTNESLSRWNTSFYMGILAFTGIATLTVSRVLLYQQQKRRQFKLSQYIVWVAVEVVVFTIILSIIAFNININSQVRFLPLLGRMMLNVVSVLAIPYTISILLFQLREKNQEIEALNAMMAEQNHPISATEEMMNFYDKGGRLAFSTKKKNVLYVEASDNYTNIHFINEEKEDCFILHSSMKQVEQAYAKQGMLRCHRGYIVNIDNVKLLRKEKDGLAIELAQSDKTIPVSKTYVDRVVHCFASTDSPNEQRA